MARKLTCFACFSTQVQGPLTEIDTMQVHHPRTRRSLYPIVAAAAAALLLGGCDMLGIETPAVTAAKKEAEGKAIGSACRHAVRSIEDCYRNNPKALKASVFDGWKEMDAYMRENSIEGMPYVPPVTGPDESLVPAEGTDNAKKDHAEAGSGSKKTEH